MIVSSYPYVTITAALVGDTEIPHAGASRFDKPEYQALVEALRLIGPDQCRAILDNPSQAHLLEAAFGKLLHVLESPAAS